MPSELTILDLLRDREYQYVMLHRCEERIRAVLGGDYPYPVLPFPPSQVKGGRRPSGSKTPTRPKVRGLIAGEENAYHIRYVYCGENRTSLCDDRALLRTLSDRSRFAAPHSAICGMAWLALGEPDTAVEALTAAAHARDSWLGPMLIHPINEALHALPEFRALKSLVFDGGSDGQASHRRRG